MSQVPPGQVVDLLEFAAQQSAYKQSCAAALEEISSMSGELVATALGLEDLRTQQDTAVGTVVCESHHSLAQSPDWRVRKLIELSALLAEAETLPWT